MGDTTGIFGVQTLALLGFSISLGSVGIGVLQASLFRNNLVLLAEARWYGSPSVPPPSHHLRDALGPLSVCFFDSISFWGVARSRVDVTRILHRPLEVVCVSSIEQNLLVCST